MSRNIVGARLRNINVECDVANYFKEQLLNNYIIDKVKVSLIYLLISYRRQLIPHASAALFKVSVRKL
jgi:hypothetical protein